MASAIDERKGHYLIIAPFRKYGCGGAWGFGDTLEAARKACRAEGGNPRAKSAEWYFLPGPRDCYRVCEVSGGLRWKTDAGAPHECTRDGRISPTSIA